MRPKKFDTTIARVQLQVRLPEDLRDRTFAEADRRHVSAATLVEWALRSALSVWEDEIL